MNNKTYSKNRRKKSFASLVLAFLLTLTFNSSPILLVSERVRSANAYKSTETKTFYSSPTNESESKFSDPNYPSSYSEKFSGSSKNFNLFTYYNSKFEETLLSLAHTFFKSYSDTNDFNTKYTEFLNSFGADTLAEFYKEQKDSAFLKEKLETVSVRDLIARIAITGFDKYVTEDVGGTPVSKSLPALVQLVTPYGEFAKLSEFYRLFANYTINGSINNGDQQDKLKDESKEEPGVNSSNLEIKTAEAFYKKASYQDKKDKKIVGNTHYNRMVDKIDSIIMESAPTYAFDHLTQDTNVAAIFADMVPTSVEYNYVANSYESYTEPSANYKTTKVASGPEKRTVYYFGSKEEITNFPVELEPYFYQSTETPKDETDMLLYRPILEGEHGYIEGYRTYYKYSSSPYLTTSSKKDVYVLTDSSTTQNELDTIASVYFKALSADEYAKNKDYYVQIPYEKTKDGGDELYFKAIYNSLYSNVGLAGSSQTEKFETFVNYFTTAVQGSTNGERNSKLYVKMGSSTKKYVYLDQTFKTQFEQEHGDYIYEVKYYDPATFNPNDYFEILENSSNASYYVKSDDYKLYFAKTKNYYTVDDTPTYDTTYETTFSPSIPLEKETVASNSYEMTGNERKIYIVSEETAGSTVQIKSIDETITYDFIAVAQETIDADKKSFFVEVPSYIYNNKNISDTYKLYYKHNAVEVNALYVVDDKDGAADNKVYQTLNYNVIKSSELKSNITSYVSVKESDTNYNKAFQLYYKYDRDVDTSVSQVYILNHTGLVLGTSSLKSIESKELSDYVLIENDKENESGTYRTYYKSITTSASIDEIKLYKKLTSVFVQNHLKEGTAVYVLDTSVSSEEKETYSRLMYTPITQKELDNNPGLYVLIDSNDESNFISDYKLYYKYQKEATPSRVIYTYDAIDKKAADFNKNGYELITSTNQAKPGDYIEGQERYYKKNVISTNTKNEAKPTFYYYQTTSTTTLSANSYYVVSFYANTIGGATASFVIKDTANLLDTIGINNIDTDGSWQKYYVFLSTNISTASTINILLMLGDEEHGVKGNTSATTVSGSVFFDDIKITKISLTDFNKHAIDDIAICSESTLMKDSNGDPIPDTYADEHDNKVIIANTDPAHSSNKFEARNYLDSTIDVYGSNTWNDIFNFDEVVNGSNTALQNYLGKDTGVEAEKVANQLASIDEKSDGFDMYNDGFTTLWKYYISRDLENDFSINKYINAYNDGKLEVTTTNKIEESEEPEKDEDKKEDDKEEDEAEKSDIKYVSSPFNKNNFALKLKNTSKDTSLGITSNSFKVKQFEYYKVSLWIYSPDLEGTATISVNSVLSDRQHPTYGSLISASINSTYANVENSSSKNDEYGWLPVNLYIEGNNFQDMDCYLVLSADADCTVYFDNIRIEKTTSAQYDTAKSNSSSDKYIAAMSLTPTTSLITSDLTNGTFDYVKESSLDHDVTSAEPYVADNWTTLSTNSSRVVAGIVSTQQDAFFDEYSKNSTFTNKGVKPLEYDSDISNVYAIYSPAQVTALNDATISAKHTYSLYSASLSLSANTVYKISFKFWKNDNFTGKVFSNIYASAVKTANIISSIEQDVTNDEVVADEEWQTFTYYIQTSTSSQTVYIEIGVKDAQNTCFFKNVSAKKLSNKTFNSLLQSEAEKEGLDSSSPETLYSAFDTVQFLNLTNIDFGFHSTEVNEDTNLFDSKTFTNTSSVTADHTAGKAGVTVATFFDSVVHTTYSVTIEKTVYYIGEVYEVTIDETKYYVHQTYDSANNRFNYKLYSDSELKNEITKIGETDVEITSTGAVKVVVGATTYETTTTYRLYKFADLREEVTSIGGLDVSVPDLEKVVVGKGAHATETTITSKQNTSYIYHFGSDTKKDYEIGNTIISAEELKNAQSGNVMILTNDHATDYVTVTQSSARSLGKSTFNVLRIYVKTSDFERNDIGLNISVKAVDVNWSNINTTKSELADEFGFVCYEILISTNSTDSISDFAVSFSLGNTKDSDTGYAIISKVSLEALSNKEAFDHYSELVGDDNENIKKAIYADKAKTTDSEEEADDKNPMNWATFFYVFSSILLVATIAVAMVAVVLKKHPIKGSEKFENEHERDIQTIPTKAPRTSNRKSRAKKDEIVIDLSNEEPKSKKDDGGIV